MKAFKKKSSSWNALQSKLSATADLRKENKVSKTGTATSTRRDGMPALNAEDDSNISAEERKRYVAMDCEMVGLGHAGKTSALARACLVDYDGSVLYDRFVRPKGYVTDFRTKYSGVRQSDLRMGEAVLFEECQRDVAKIMKGKVLVGHALKNDTDAMMLSHPRTQIRDTAQYRPLMRTIGGPDKVKYRPRALRDLAKQHLGITIQAGEHDPSVDARTAMSLYKKFRLEWEASIKARNQLARSKAAGDTEISESDVVTGISSSKNIVQTRAAGYGCAAQRARAVKAAAKAVAEGKPSSSPATHAPVVIFSGSKRPRSNHHQQDPSRKPKVGASTDMFASESKGLRGIQDVDVDKGASLADSSLLNKKKKRKT